MDEILLKISYLAASDDEEGFWATLLVFVVLAAGWGAYNLFKTRAQRLSGRGQHRRFRPVDIAKDAVSEWFTGLKTVVTPKEAGRFTKDITVEQTLLSGPKKRDLQSGMELLAKDFLVEVAEQTDNTGHHDIAICRLCFNELVRRGELRALSSNALKIYITDEQGSYGKSIQCEAMEELANRTKKSPQDKAEDTTVSATENSNG